LVVIKTKTCTFIIKIITKKHVVYFQWLIIFLFTLYIQRGHAMKRFFVPIAALTLVFAAEACAQPYGFYRRPFARPFAQPAQPFVQPFAQPFAPPLVACPPPLVIVPQQPFFAPVPRGFIGRPFGRPYCAPRHGWGRRRW
jgi:hypothetical protein